MNVRQMIRLLKHNADCFVDSGEIEKSLAAISTAAVLKRDFYDVKGDIDWFSKS